MSTLLLERSLAFDESFERETPHRLDGAFDGRMADAYGKLTLDDVITGAWEGLAVRGTVTCPVCANPMVAQSPGHGDDALTGACLSCGSRLS